MFDYIFISVLVLAPLCFYVWDRHEDSITKFLKLFSNTSQATIPAHLVERINQPESGDLITDEDIEEDDDAYYKHVDFDLPCEAYFYDSGLHRFGSDYDDWWDD